MKYLLLMAFLAGCECDWGQSERDHARAIEAKLKDKNTRGKE